MDSQFVIIIYVVYFVLLAIVFGIVRFLLNKIFRKEISKKKMGIFFLILLVLPFALIKGCKSCMDDMHEEYIRERTQESYVRNFLTKNEASALILPKFKVNTYENDISSGEKWTIEFEEPIDSTQLQKLDQSNVAKVNGRVLFFPIVYGYSDEIDDVFLTEEYYDKIEEAKEAENPDEEPDSKYDYRNFRLELLPDCKTAILLYSYHMTFKERHSSGGSSHHHFHHDD